jgi:hypothetical protein
MRIPWVSKQAATTQNTNPISPSSPQFLICFFFIFFFLISYYWVLTFSSSLDYAPFQASQPLLFFFFSPQVPTYTVLTPWFLGCSVKGLFHCIYMHELILFGLWHLYERFSPIKLSDMRKFMVWFSGMFTRFREFGNLLRIMSYFMLSFWEK